MYSVLYITNRPLVSLVSPLVLSRNVVTLEWFSTLDLLLYLCSFPFVYVSAFHRLVFIVAVVTVAASVVPKLE